MLQQPRYAWTGDDADLARLVRAHPWITMVSVTDEGPVVSHLPLVPDPAVSGFAVLGHLPLDDARRHGLGTASTVLVVQGPHGYVSADWYVDGPAVSTWNFVVAHLHGVARPLGAEDTLRTLRLTQEHFESRRDTPFELSSVDAYVRRLARHVVGFRLAPTRVDAKAKLGQGRSAADIAAVLAALDDPDEVFNAPDLAEAMRRGGIPR